MNLLYHQKENVEIRSAVLYDEIRKRVVEMKFCIGIDGGGTKTAFRLCDESGICLAETVKSGCSWLEIGVDAVIELLISGISECMEKAQVKECSACCIGLPCFGENAEMDALIEKRIKEKLAPMRVKIVNDAVVGWAGSLQLQEGIHLVAGTGSLALGKGVDDRFARSGGWNEFFSDEGSCYWVAKEAMTLFSKQADGRIEKGPLYDLVCKEYQLKNDFEFIDVVLNKMAPYRDKVASFQYLVLKAAEAGDASVQKLYERAAHELAEMVFSVKRQLTFSASQVRVSYYGGLFHASKWVLPALEKELVAQNCILCTPRSTASEGAVLMAMELLHEELNHE